LSIRQSRTTLRPIGVNVQAKADRDARNSKRVDPAITLRNAIAKEWRLRLSSFATLFYANL
jgi:hypothetical protein